MLYCEARLAALRRKHQSLIGKIDQERNRPTPDNSRMVDLKRQIMRVTNEIGRVQTREMLVT
jgi:hypothetical protein